MSEPGLAVLLRRSLDMPPGEIAERGDAVALIRCKAARYRRRADFDRSVLPATKGAFRLVAGALDNVAAEIEAGGHRDAAGVEAAAALAEAAR